MKKECPSCARDRMGKSFRESDRGKCKYCANWERNQRAWRKAHGVNEGKVSFRQWRGIMETYENRCCACGIYREKLSIDHVIPLSAGGTHTVDNVQPLCLRCNKRKYTAAFDFRPLAARGIYVWSQLQDIRDAAQRRNILRTLHAA